MIFIFSLWKLILSDVNSYKLIIFTDSFKLSL